jgi:hypothetical protein
MAEAKEPSLQGLNALVGEWDIDATHPMVPSTVVHGHSVFEWLEGEKFLIVRARSDHPDFPDSISIIGDTGGLRMHYFDSRGVKDTAERVASCAKTLLEGLEVEDETVAS